MVVAEDRTKVKRSVILTAGQLARIGQRATERDVSESLVIRQALDIGLRQLDRLDPLSEDVA